MPDRRCRGERGAAVVDFVLVLLVVVPLFLGIFQVAASPNQGDSAGTPRPSTALSMSAPPGPASRSAVPSRVASPVT